MSSCSHAYLKISKLLLSDVWRFKEAKQCAAHYITPTHIASLALNVKVDWHVSPSRAHRQSIVTAVTQFKQNSRVT